MKKRGRKKKKRRELWNKGIFRLEFGSWIFKNQVREKSREREREREREESKTDENRLRTKAKESEKENGKEKLDGIERD